MEGLPSPWPRAWHWRALAALWASLAILTGLLGAVLFWATRQGRLRAQAGAVEVLATGSFGAWMIRRGWGGYTLGATIFYWDLESADDLDTRRHERRHVRQYLCFGFLMPLVYGLALLVGPGYEQNPLERDAYLYGKGV